MRNSNGTIKAIRVCASENYTKIIASDTNVNWTSYWLFKLFE